jgi:hypothetical protein
VHTRRVAAFFLGAWIAGCLFMAYVAIYNLRSYDAILHSNLPPAARIVHDLGDQPAALLLRHHAAEINRGLFHSWGKAQIGLGLLLLGALFLGTDRRILPLVLGGIMLAMVLFQNFGVEKELSYRGRETDFPPLNTDFTARQRVWTMHQIYLSVEGVKLLTGCVLGGYLFMFRARRRRRSEDTIDQPE